MKVEHNIIDGGGSGAGISTQASDAQLSGNIFTNISGYDIEAQKLDTANWQGISASDYNIFSGTPQFVVDRLTLSKRF